MRLQSFADFLIEKTEGKITQSIINTAFFKIEDFNNGFFDLGEFLISEKAVTREEFNDYLVEFKGESR